jgi:uncharacterized protein YndB with AHSA1/START domain
MTTTSTTTAQPDLATTQVHRIYIKASAQAIWDAITRPEWTARYGYTGYVDYDLRPGGRFECRATPEFRAAAAAGGNDLPEVIIDGEVLECEPPYRLVQTWRMLMDEHVASEGFTRLSYEIKEMPDGSCRLTVTHELEQAPTLALIVSGALEDTGAGGGFPWILSDLKSLLETGQGFAG